MKLTAPCKWVEEFIASDMQPREYNERIVEKIQREAMLHALYCFTDKPVNFMVWIYKGEQVDWWIIPENQMKHFKEWIKEKGIESEIDERLRQIRVKEPDFTMTDLMDDWLNFRETKRNKKQNENQE